jgi:hypothetical protein
MPSIECKKCLFFKTKQGKGKKGECHRYPPTEHDPVTNGPKKFPTWPDVKPTQWCGEFRPDATNSLEPSWWKEL